MKMKSNLNKNIFAGSIAAGGSIIISIIAYPLYLHFLGAELYGLWVILNVVVYFSTLANFGIDEAIIKYIAEECEHGNYESVKHIFSTGLNMLFIGGVLVFTVLFFLRSLLMQLLHLSSNYGAIFFHLFPYVILLAIFIILIIYINAVLKGMGRYDQASYILLFGRIMSVLFSIPFLLMNTGIWALYWGQFISYVCVLLISSVFIYRKLGFFYILRSFDKKIFAKIMKFGGVLTASKALAMFLEPFMKFVIARFVGLSAVTYFEISNRIVIQIRSLFERGISAIMPEISRLSVTCKDAQQQLRKVMKKVNVWNMITGSCVFILLFILAKPILQIWLGTEYQSTIFYALRILIIAYMINLFSVPAYYYFMGVARVGFCLLNHSLQSGLNFSIIVILMAVHSITFDAVIFVYALSIAISALLLIVVYYIMLMNAQSKDSSVCV
jgi:O-antigen/teichoic acid export membrane protein